MRTIKMNDFFEYILFAVETFGRPLIKGLFALSVLLLASLALGVLVLHFPVTSCVVLVVIVAFVIGIHLD